MKTWLFFDSMVTPKIITILYWIALIGIVLSGLGIMVGGSFGVMNIIFGILTIVFGALGVRVSCELIMVIFKINDALQDMRHK